MYSNYVLRKKVFRIANRYVRHDSLYDGQLTQKDGIYAVYGDFDFFYLLECTR